MPGPLTAGLDSVSLFSAGTFNSAVSPSSISDSKYASLVFRFFLCLTLGVLGGVGGVGGCVL